MIETVADFMAFKRLLTPVLVTLVWFVAAVILGGAGIVLLLGGNLPSAAIAFGILVASRIVAELFVVAFSISEALADIRAELRAQRPPAIGIHTEMRRGEPVA